MVKAGGRGSTIIDRYNVALRGQSLRPGQFVTTTLCFGMRCGTICDYNTLFWNERWKY
jgi:hypothetical protein